MRRALIVAPNIVIHISKGVEAHVAVAMACGKPVIGRNIPAIAEQVDKSGSA